MSQPPDGGESILSEPHKMQSKPVVIGAGMSVSG
jgi:hypothetical protein